MPISADRRIVPGEIFHLDIRHAKAVRHDDDGYVYFDYAGPDGATIRGSVKLGDENVMIHPVLPAAGTAKVGQLWTNAKGAKWFAVANPSGEPLLCDEQGWKFRLIEVHRDHGPIWPVHDVEEPLTEAETKDWYYTSDDLHHIVHHPDGTTWDLSMNFVDADGHNWCWTGDLYRYHGGPLEPKMTRTDGSAGNIPWSQLRGLKYAPEA